MSRAQGGSRAFPPALFRLPRLSTPMWVTVAALAATAALLPGIWSFPGIVAIVLVVWIVLQPEVALYLLALSVPFGYLLEVEAGSFTFTPTEGLVALLVVGWAVRSLANRRVTIPVTPLTIPLAAMLGVVMISAYQATEISLTIKETLKWLELILIYLFVVTEMDSMRRALSLVLALLAAASVEALLGFGQFALGIGPDFFAIGRFMRAYGTFEQPNPFAGYLGMLVPLGLALLLAQPSPRVRRYLLLSSLLAIGGVGISLSRGAWVGLALGISAMMLLWSRRSSILLAAGAVAASPLAALAFLNLLPQEITSRLATALDYFRFVDVTAETANSQNWAVLERVAHWQAALNMIAASPIFGVGAGNYPAAYPWYAVPGWPMALGHAHNFYLNIAAETGIPGLIIYLTLMLTALLHTMTWLVRSNKVTSPSNHHGPAPGEQDPQPHARLENLFWRALLLGVFGSLLTVTVHNMFDSLFVHGMSVQLGMILAFAHLSVNALRGSSSAVAREHRGALPIG